MKSTLHCLLIALLLALAAPIYAQDPPYLRSSKAVESKPGSISPRALLEMWKISDSHWDLLLDGRPQVGEENETLTMLLFRMPDFLPEQWDKWCKEDADPAALVAAPKEQHGKPFIVRGRAKKVELVDLHPPELIQLYQFRKFYRVTIAMDGSPHPVVVCTREIPALWKDVTELDEPVRVQAIFMKAGEADGDATPLYFVSARIGWLPDKPNEKLGATEDLVWLAARGMDVALWDVVRANNGTPIGATENEAFYTLLATLKRATPEQLKALPARTFDLETVLTKPDGPLGRGFTAVGSARRIQKVAVPERFRERLGIDHYYEIDLFLPLDKHVRLTPPGGKKDSPAGKAKSPTSADEETPIYTDGFPATFNVVKLPPELEEGEVRKQIRLHGVYYKLWAYQSDYTKQFNPNMRQPSPLLMGLMPEVVPDPVAADWEKYMPGLVIGAIMIGVGAVWFGAWRAARGDQKFERKVLRKFTRGEAAPDKIAPPPDHEPPPAASP